MLDLESRKDEKSKKKPWFKRFYDMIQKMGQGWFVFVRNTDCLTRMYGVGIILNVCKLWLYIIDIIQKTEISTVRHILYGKINIQYGIVEKYKQRRWICFQAELINNTKTKVIYSYEYSNSTNGLALLWKRLQEQNTV